ncbi:hypothetical protein MCETOYE15_00030 [Candidatus Nanopelagicaceae bacterium]
MKLINQKYFLYWIAGLEFLILGIAYQFPPGDSRLIVDAGARILQGINPYFPYDFGNFAVTGLIFTGIDEVLGIKLMTGLLFTLNVLGILTFAFAISKFKNFQVNRLLILIPLTISSRALFADGQITGLILLLISIPLLINGNSIAKLVGSVIPLTLAMELKPHMALPFCIAVSVIAGRKTIVPLVTLIMALIHTAIGLIYGFSLDSGWLESLKSRSDRSFQRGAEFSIWKLLYHFVQEPNLYKIASLAIYISLIFVLATHKLSPQVSLILASLAPLTLSYQHAYDWISAVICLVCLTSTSEKARIILIAPLVTVYPLTYLVSYDLLYSTLSCYLLVYAIKILFSRASFAR